MIEISSVLRTKLAALRAIPYQMEFSARHLSKRIDPELLEYLVPDAEVRGG